MALPSDQHPTANAPYKPWAAIIAVISGLVALRGLVSLIPMVYFHLIALDAGLPGSYAPIRSGCWTWELVGGGAVLIFMIAALV